MVIRFVPKKEAAQLPKKEALPKNVANDVLKNCAVEPDCLKIEQESTISQIIAATVEMWHSYDRIGK